MSAGIPAEPDGNRPPLDDANLAAWLAERDMTGWRYAAGVGWLRWDGRRWASATDVAAAEAVRRAVVDLQIAEAKAGSDVDRQRQALSLLTAHRIAALTRVLRGVTEIDTAALDARPDLLNVGNGVVDLAAGKLLPHDPDLLLTKLTAVDYRPGATHGDWDKALTALPADVAAYLQLRVGQAATGHMTDDDVLPILQGGGANGKTTLTSAITTALGEHAVTVSDRVLLANPGDHPTELTELQGARLAMLEETPEARHLDVQRLKRIVGTPTMTARRIRQDSITWRTTHSLFIASNYLPRVDETDYGTWRRLQLIRFGRTFAGADRDPGLRERLTRGHGGRAEAVLAWIVEGARRWYDNGQVMADPPATVAADTRAWRAEADVVLRFITEHLAFDAARCIPSAELFSRFNAWLDSIGQRPWSDQVFSARFGGHSEVEARGVAKRRTADLAGVSTKLGLPTGKVVVWQGLRWRGPTDTDGADEAATAPVKPQVDTGGRGTWITEKSSFMSVNQQPLPPVSAAPPPATSAAPPPRPCDADGCDKPSRLGARTCRVHALDPPRRARRDDAADTIGGFNLARLAMQATRERTIA